MKRRIPRDQISTKYPSYPSSIMISGARYAGVPHYSFITWPFLMIFETPKSQILTPFSLSKRILSNLISRWMTDLQCICASPYTIYLNMNLASDSWRAPFRLSNLSKSPPPAYSMTMSKCLFDSNTSSNLMTLECLIFLSK